MTDIQIQKIKEVCGEISRMQYTKNYKITKFTVLEEDTDVRIDYTVTRKCNINNKNYSVNYYGRLFITPRGKKYKINFMGNKKNFKYISQTLYKEESVTE